MPIISHIIFHLDPLEFTVFVMPRDLFSGIRMPQGYTSASSAFVRQMHCVIATSNSMHMNLDDAMVLDLTLDLHVERIRQFLDRLGKHNLR